MPQNLHNHAARRSSHLPEPPPELAELSQRLRGRILKEISNDGPITFSRYMELALYQPGLGYYRNGLVRFGRDGDFVTAPELGGLFARSLARQFDELNPRGDWTLMEIGAGSGVLARDLLAELEHPPERYFILETSGELRDRQRRAIDALPDPLKARVDWLDAPPAGPFKGVILANEVLDALPVSRFEITDNGPVELRVDADRDGQFTWTREQPGPRLAERLSHLLDDLPTPLPTGYRSEICVDLPDWLKTVSEPLREGLVLMIDYGYPRAEYYRPDRRDGTLVGHYRHRAHFDPFLWPGLTDLSTFVDFTAVAEAADACALDVLGCATQAHFLLSLGITDFLEGETDPLQQANLARELRTLTLPGEMGEKFKVMALGRNLPEPPPGFTIDELHRL